MFFRGVADFAVFFGIQSCLLKGFAGNYDLFLVALWSVLFEEVSSLLLTSCRRIEDVIPVSNSAN